VIASLAGVLERSAPGQVVIDVAGIGYRVSVSLSTYSSLPPQGDGCRLRVVTIVREDEISLYGFATGEEEELFRLLQGVSGVGPKLALKVLSGLSAADLRRALVAGNETVLTTIPGVGKRLAQRLVVELRDRAGPIDDLASQTSPAGVRVDAEALQALESLGYSHRIAEQALGRAQEAGASTLEERVREALRALAPKR
jgi:Holliday junction DNA helicase RuvA